jgi:hypothetical protein
LETTPPAIRRAFSPSSTGCRLIESRLAFRSHVLPVFERVTAFDPRCIEQQAETIHASRRWRPCFPARRLRPAAQLARKPCFSARIHAGRSGRCRGHGLGPLRRESGPGPRWSVPRRGDSLPGGERLTEKYVHAGGGLLDRVRIAHGLLRAIKHRRFSTATGGRGSHRTPFGWEGCPRRCVRKRNPFARIVHHRSALI